MNNFSVYITGPDGVGKTTYIKEIKNSFLNDNVKEIWLRSPKIFSKPLMFLCRIIGLTKYYYIDGVQYGQHYIYKSKKLSYVFYVLQLLDFKIKWFFLRKSIDKNDILLIDRFSLDTLADLMVSTRNFNLHNSWIGKSFINMLPTNLRLIVLDVNEDTIRKRKKDTLYDENLANKIRVYTILAKHLNIKRIDNNRKYSVVKNEILKFIR